MSKTPLTNLSEAERVQAFERFALLRPFLEEGIPLRRVAREHGIALRTSRRWVSLYRRAGFAGLARKERNDRGEKQFSEQLLKAIEGLALKKQPLSAAAIHCQSVTIAERLGEPSPSYSTVYALIRNLDPGLVTLAREGTKAYAETFDLIHRHEASGPNAVWQADHTELDIWLKDGRGQPEKPWLTVILDDYSRAVAGYVLSFSDPSAIQTALALRQAIWRKDRPGWQVWGIPGVLYSDQGSDFTSHHIEQVAADLKIRLAALRKFFDVLVVRHVVNLNPAASVRAERYAVVEGKAPEICAKQARDLLRSVDPSTLGGLRDRAIIAVLIYTAARVGAVAKLTLKSLKTDGTQYALRFSEKGGKSREIPVRHDLEQILRGYIDAARITDGPLFRTAIRRTKQLTVKAMSGIDICRMMKRRLKAAGLTGQFSPHSFRVATVTDLLEQNVPLEDVQHLAGHADPRTTRLYDRRRKKVTRNIVKRITI